MDIGYTITNLLEKHNMSQKALAELLKIAPTTLNGYIRNKHEPDYKTLIQIADIFGVSVDFILEHKVREPAAEKLFAKKFTALEPQQQEIIIGMLEIMTRQNGRKK